MRYSASIDLNSDNPCGYAGALQRIKSMSKESHESESLTFGEHERPKLTTVSHVANTAEENIYQKQKHDDSSEDCKRGHARDHPRLDASTILDRLLHVYSH